jgi:hypothetical protein
MAEGSLDEGPTGDSFLRFEHETGVEVVVNGDESRRQIARRVIEHREAISGQAVRLLESFMRDRGVFHLSSIEVFAEKTPDRGDFSLWYTFIADRDPHEYGYTYFEVYFWCHEPPQEPFWPFKFTVGFH